MRYVTREFAHMETLERAKRWLTEVGFHPSRIEVHTHGTLRLTIKVEAGQAERSRTRARCRGRQRPRREARASGTTRITITALP